MGFQEILLIVAGGVFIFLMLLYAALAIERYKINKRNTEKLADSYTEKNLRRMEYDIAFYDGSNSGRESESQVAMDDLFSEGHVTDEAQSSDAALFASIEYEGVEEITGDYNPETVS